MCLNGRNETFWAPVSTLNVQGLPDVASADLSAAWGTQGRGKTAHLRHKSARRGGRVTAPTLPLSPGRLPRVRGFFAPKSRSERPIHRFIVDQPWTSWTSGRLQPSLKRKSRSLNPRGGRFLTRCLRIAIPDLVKSRLTTTRCSVYTSILAESV